MKIESHDIYLCAFLLVRGCTYKGKRRQERRVWLQFESDVSFAEHREAYFMGAVGSLYAYAQQVQACKELVMGD